MTILLQSLAEPTGTGECRSLVSPTPSWPFPLSPQQDSVPLTATPAAVAAWRARGIPAYALLQREGFVRVFAGAFETTAHTALLAASLREAGQEPVVAYRTGRAF